MQILAFSHSVGSQQTFLENTTDHVTFRNSHTGMALFGMTGVQQKESIIIKNKQTDKQTNKPGPEIDVAR